MDLKDLANKQEPIDVPLVFDDDGNAVDGVKVVSADSQEYQEADRAWKTANVKKVARRGPNFDMKTEEGAQAIVDTTEKREMAVAIACTVGIYGFTLEGKPAELNDETLRMLFTAKPTWRSKVVGVIERDRVFTRA